MIKFMQQYYVIFLVCWVLFICLRLHNLLKTGYVKVSLLEIVMHVLTLFISPLVLLLYVIVEYGDKTLFILGAKKLPLKTYWIKYNKDTMDIEGWSHEQMGPYHMLVDKPSDWSSGNIIEVKETDWTTRVKI